MKKTILIGFLLVLAGLLVLSGCSKEAIAGKAIKYVDCGGADSTHKCVTSGSNPSKVIATGNAACVAPGMSCTNVEQSCHNVVGGTPRWSVSRVACASGSIPTACAYRAVCASRAVPATNATNTTCTPATVAYGSVGSYPACTITCNTGYTLSGGRCVAAVPVTNTTNTTNTTIPYSTSCYDSDGNNPRIRGQVIQNWSNGGITNWSEYCQYDWSYNPYIVVEAFCNGSRLDSIQVDCRTVNGPSSSCYNGSTALGRCS